jgi:tetratricopeptide (TPR) repeat protein
MAFNKAKVLQEAHKYVAQGKTGKAIKQYEWIIEKDPSDLILLNVIGDLYAQEDNVSQALKYFYKLADAYTREGYKVKAIAIYKKISKLDRDKVEPLLRLAELNSSQGLAREACEQYKNAFELFERRGQKEKALEILRKLCQLDPRSHSLRLKLAQFAESAGETRQAADAYFDAAVLADESGDPTACGTNLHKAAELAPDNAEVHLFRARQALANQRPEEVKDILDTVPELLRKPQAKRLLLDSYLATSNLEAARGLVLDVMQSNPSDFVPVAEFTQRCIEKQRPDAALKVLMEAAPVLIARRDTGLFMETLHKLWRASPERIDILEFIYQVAEKSADEATIPEILDALGNAYVQTEQFEQAEQSYARLVAREPENETYKDLLRKVLEKQGKEFVPLSQTPLISSDVGLESGSDPALGGAGVGLPVDPEQAAIVQGAITNSEFFARDGLTERAVEELEKVLRVYPDQSEIHMRILEICREKVPGRAAQAAEVLARVCEERGNDSEAKQYQEEALELGRVAPKVETGSLVSTQATGASPSDGATERSPRSVEINLSQPADGEGHAGEETELPPPKDISLDFQFPQKAGPATSGPAASQRGAFGEMTSQRSAELEGAPEVLPAFNYEETREEIEFYLRHGFYDEAQKAVSELERKYPGESRVSEFRQRVDRLSQEPRPSEDPRTAAGPVALDTAEAEWDLPTSFSGTTEAGNRLEGGQPSVPGAGRRRDNGVEDLASELASTLEGFADPATGPASSAAQSSRDAAPKSVADASEDLGSLLDELNDTNDSVDQSADDDQTHYNLGVAFREMGLLDEAIGEFQKVVNGTGPNHFGPYFLQGCTLLASCFMDKEMPAIAAKWYLRALDAPGLNHDGTLALYYDLGTALENAGNTTAALEKFTEVYSQNIDYRDVAEKIRLLRQTSR